MKTFEIPMRECMFARLPRPAGSGRERHQELVFGFEAQLPLPIDEVHMAFVDSGTHVIAVACTKAMLEPLRASYERAIPDALPPWLGEHDDQVRHRMNLLAGPMKPIALIRRQDATLKLACAIFVMISFIVFFAANKKAERLEAQTRLVQADIQALYREVLPPALSGNVQPDAVRFATLLNQLSATRTGVVDNSAQALIPPLASILSAWPSDTQAQVRSLTIDEAGLRIVTSMPDNQRAAELLAHMRSVDGYEVKSHQTTPARDRVELTMQLAHTRTEGVRDGQ